MKATWYYSAPVLEVLNSALVLFRFLERLERTQVTTLTGFRVGLARIEPVLAGFELSDHA